MAARNKNELISGFGEHEFTDGRKQSWNRIAIHVIRLLIPRFAEIAKKIRNGNIKPQNRIQEIISGLCELGLADDLYKPRIEVCIILSLFPSFSQALLLIRKGMLLIMNKCEIELQCPHLFTYPIMLLNPFVDLVQIHAWEVISGFRKFVLIDDREYLCNLIFF